MIGLGLLGAAYIARVGILGFRSLKTRMGGTAARASTSHFYKGGFQGTMDKREAALILDVTENAPKEKIREKHRKILVLNHPDKGGSPYMATKINEAKQVMEDKKLRR